MFHSIVIGICTAILVQPPTDIEQLQGTWVVTSAVMNGDPFVAPERHVWTLTFGKENKILVRKTAKPDLLWRFDLDPDAPTKRIDVTVGDGQNQRIDRGIYQLERDRLTLAFSSVDQQPRPTTFDLDQKALVLILEKQKPGSSDKTAPVKLAIFEPNCPPDEKWLAGRWELVLDKAPKPGESMRMEIEFLVGDKMLEIRHMTTKPALIGLTSKSERKSQFPFVIGPDGKKDAIGIAEELIDKENKTWRSRIVDCNLRGEVLELAGELRSSIGGNFNLTGRWRRLSPKQ